MGVLLLVGTFAISTNRGSSFLGTVDSKKTLNDNEIANVEVSGIKIGANATVCAVATNQAAVGIPNLPNNYSCTADYYADGSEDNSIYLDLPVGSYYNLWGFGFDACLEDETGEGDTKVFLGQIQVNSVDDTFFDISIDGENQELPYKYVCEEAYYYRVTMKKEWDDNNNAYNKRASAIYFSAYSYNSFFNGEDYYPYDYYSYTDDYNSECEATADTDWTCELDIASSASQSGIVFLEEPDSTEVNTNYDSDGTYDDNWNLYYKVVDYDTLNNSQEVTFNNTYNGDDSGEVITPENIDITVSASWDDHNNEDNIRPTSVTAELLNGTTVVETINLTSSSSWSSTVTVPKTTVTGTTINYTIRLKTTTPSGYTSTINGYQLKFTHAPTINITVTNTWDDDNNADNLRPSSIIAEIVNGNTVTKTATLTEANSWKSTVSVPKYNASGTAITYTVRQRTTITGYTTTVNGYNITNSHEPSVNITIKNTWDDDNNSDNIRPTSVIAEVLNGTTVVETVTLNASNSWTKTVTLPKNNASGTAITYTVRQKDSISGYTTTIDGYNIKNTHIPQVSITVTNTWQDDNNSDNIRPTSVIAEVLNGTTVVETVTLNASNSWTKTVTLPKNNASGTAITYTVRQKDSISGYTTTIDGYNIKNTHIPNKNITINSTWDDNNDQDGKRPTSIIAEVLNGTTVVETITLKESENWQSTVSLPKTNDAGVTINYTIRLKNPISGYTTTINGYTIKNAHTSEVVSFNIKVNWENEEEEEIPDSFNVKLLANGVEIQSFTILKSNGWNYPLSNLPKYENGREIIYSITTDMIENFSSTLSGNQNDDFVITNESTPETRKYQITTEVICESGTITGDEEVLHGTNSTQDRIVITSNEGYVIDYLLVNGERIDDYKDSDRLVYDAFTNVTEDKSVKVCFKEKPESEDPEENEDPNGEGNNNSGGGNDSTEEIENPSIENPLTSSPLTIITILMTTVFGTLFGMNRKSILNKITKK